MTDVLSIFKICGYDNPGWNKFRENDGSNNRIIQLGDFKSMTLILSIQGLSHDYRNVQVKDVIVYELEPVSTTMFNEDRIRICKD